MKDAVKILLVIIIFCLSTECCSLSHCYVNPSGNDINDCLTISTPCKTILGCDTVVVGLASYPATIHVAAGVYTGSNNVGVSFYNAAGPISIVGQGAGLSIISGGGISWCWQFSSGFYTFSGLTFDGCVGGKISLNLLV